MILQALTADAFSRARIVTAVAFLKIPFFVAFHRGTPDRFLHRLSPFPHQYQNPTGKALEPVENRLTNVMDSLSLLPS